MACSREWETRLQARGLRPVAGVDEAGRGPLAGPVVACAVILPDDFALPGLDDSKKLSAIQRERCFGALTAHAAVVYAVGICEAAEVDQLNILRATHEAMRRALAGLALPAGHALVDGRPVPGLPVEHTALVGGDGLSVSIAAASVIAKVTRDRLMREWDSRYPQYGFSRHKGYGTAEHLARLAEHGPCPIHRRSFAPVSQTAFGF